MSWKHGLNYPRIYPLHSNYSTKYLKSTKYFDQTYISQEVTDSGDAGNSTDDKIT